MSPDDEFTAGILPFADELYRFARRMTVDPHDAEDLVQETYAKAWKSRHTFTPGTNLRAWLFKILANSWNDQHRKTSKQPTDLGLVSGDRGTHGDDVLPATDSAEHSALADLGDSGIRRALEKLPEQMRLAVLVADVAGFSYRETAGILGVPIGTVMSRLHRGRRALKAELRAVVARSMASEAVPDGLTLHLSRKFEGAADPDSADF